MCSDVIIIKSEALTAAVSQSLINSLNLELIATYSEPGATHFGLHPEEVEGTRGVFLVVYHEDVPVGCGAVRMISARTGELKRMYIVPEMRGRGAGRLLVAALEAEARSRGAKRLILETGIRQTAAIALYQTSGFVPIPLYGEYLQSPETSLCFGKKL